MYDERRNPGKPWLTRDAVKFLQEALKPTDVGLEFGSGRSSVWFAHRMRHLVSVEDNPEWYERVGQLIAQQNLGGKIDYRLRRGEADYVAEGRLAADNSVDFCLVDGNYRDACALTVMPKIRPGGLLVVDNINWFLPSTSVAPASRRQGSGCENDSWGQFMAAVADWRRYWTTNGVTDTCIWLKP